MWMFSKVFYSNVDYTQKLIFPVVKGMYSNVFLLTPSFTIRLKCLLDNTPAFSKINPGLKSVFGPFLEK